MTDQHSGNKFLHFTKTNFEMRHLRLTNIRNEELYFNLSPNLRPLLSIYFPLKKNKSVCLYFQPQFFPSVT